MNRTINIGNKSVGFNCPVFIVAEISANHNQNYDHAVELIKVAKESGADAVKIQTYTPETITIDCDDDCFQIKQNTIWDGITLFKLYQSAYTPWEWQPKLKQVADEEDIVFFSSPFDFSSIDFLESINVPAYKIASFEITDIPLIKYAASKKKPIIISTGVANYDEIVEAIDTCKSVGNEEIIILKCASHYPSVPEELNLKTIPYIKEKFKLITGLSDHSIANTSAIAAVALGAKVIEKHIKLNNNDKTPDSEFSLTPAQFKSLVESVRETELSLGDVTFNLSESQLRSKEHSRSLFAVKDIAKGETITKDNVKSIRPYNGLHPRHYEEILGKKAKFMIMRGTPMSWNIIE